ncbi:hypothetical protein B4923_18820 [Brenneria roseae subsp. americana]|uniref:Uncharacterized protein n=1 Tax=Brenneria roseae subsp. americana TaxID=1508507 RepID=A0A2U1TK81_9GAMM|nr:hypothetical protein [Brenneria roseae]PWC09769.1 hypothetical protein B4923_18820 [Brenneria roseae subsp. americana]
MRNVTGTQNEFIDTQYWPLVFLHMPEQVPDEQAGDYLAQIEVLYARHQPFVLCMTGADLPHHSSVFMAAYLQWTTDNVSLQQQYCAGAIRIESDDAKREKYRQWARNWAKSGNAPYLYAVVATLPEARALAPTLLDRQ